MRGRWTRICGLFPLAALALAGCKVGPNFTPPQVTAPAAWGPEPTDVDSRTYGGPIDVQWWGRFGDPELTSLVGRLASQNLDLKQAAERVAQAKAERRVVRAQALPNVNGQGFYQNVRSSENGVLKLFTPAPGAPLEFDLFQDQAAASWELDLFGRVRRAVEAASADEVVQVEARRSLALSAIAELSQDYLQLRGVQAREAVTQHNIDLSNQRQKLVRDQLANGTSAILDVAEAAAQTATIAEDLPALHAEEARLINAVALLLAEPPRALEGELKPPRDQPGTPPTVPVGLPGDLVRRRPDVREAEARLHEATAQTGVAVADFFPSVTLNASLGTQSLTPAHVFDWTSRMFMIGPSLSVPIFEGGRLKGTLDLRQSQQREAALAYQQTVLQSWHDVDNAMTAYAETQHRRGAILTALHNNELALAAAQQRYRQGVVDFLNVIAAQTAVLQSQDTLVQTNTEMTVDLVNLYRALGGGWQAAESMQTASQH